MKSGKYNVGVGLIGLLMPIGILAEIYFGAPPLLVLLGAISMTSAVALAGVLSFRFWGHT